MRGTDSFHNMCVMNTDALYQRKKYWEKCLQTVEKDNKKKYLEACSQKFLHSPPFFVSAVGLLRDEAEATLQRITIRLVIK